MRNVMLLLAVVAVAGCGGGGEGEVTTTESGLKYVEVKEGDGDVAEKGMIVSVH